MTVLNLMFSILLLIVVTWMVIFGGVGGLLARAREGSVTAGIAWGIIFGPFGWLAIVWTTRGKPPVLPEAAAPPSESEWLTSGASWDD